MLRQDRLLIIGGTGRNSGKSTLAESLIARFADRGIVGLKITPHDHPNMSGLTLIAEGEQFKVFEEKNPLTEKDSSRMLRSGAARVFLIVARNSSPADAWLSLQSHLPAAAPLVCESPALRRFVRPDLFVVMTHAHTNNRGNKNIDDLLPLADLILTIDDIEIGKAEDIDLDEDNNWYLKSW